MIYGEISSDKVLVQALEIQDGPGAFDPMPDHTYRQLDQLPDMAQPTPTSVLRWEDDWPAPQWVETATLADLVAAGISDIDSTADAARLDVLSRPTNSEEYRQAETQAREFKAAGYPATDVPEDVDSWASAKYRDGWTAQQAADDIIATADTWRGLLSSIRRLRLSAKEDVRHAADGAGITARVGTFKTDLANLMKGLA
jgi:hypothetical protein